MHHLLDCRRGWLARLLVLVALLGCGTSGGGSQFPSRQQIEKLAERPAAAYSSKGERADVDEWELTGPLPSQIGDEPATLDEPWARVATRLADKRPGLILASNAAACTAREIGLFYAAKRAGATESLERFMAARCGLTGTPMITHGYRYQEVRGAVDERTIANEWSPVLEGEMQKALGSSSGPHLIGIWFGRRQDLVVATWVIVPRQARVDPMAMVPSADGQVVIRGEVLHRAEKVEGLINHGRYGFQRCEADPAVPMPQFLLRCQSNKDDDSANLQVAAFEPGRVLGRIILSFVLWPKGELGRRYHRPSLADAGGSSSANLATELATMVDRIRKQAGMKTLQLSQPESQSARRLAPHYFAALIGLEDEAVADLVVLGLRAGWDVGARLRTGRFTSGAAEGSVSAERMLSDVLDAPSGREALLDPEIDHIAIGVVGSPAQGLLGALFATYANFELGAVPLQVEKVERRLNELRARKGLPQVQRLSKLEPDLSAIVAKVTSGELSASQGLQQVTEAAASRMRGGVRAYSVEAIEFDQLAIPDDIVALPSVHVAICVGEHQPAGDPWHRFVVYLVIAEGQDVVAQT